MTPYFDDGQITIYCADARDLLPLFPDKSFDMIFTDPPYWHNNNDGDLIHRWEAALGVGNVTDNDARPIANDGAKDADDLVRWFFPECARLLRRGCCCCCCCGGGGGPDPQFARWSTYMDAAIGFKHAVVWDKGGLGMGWHYRRSYEFVLIGEVKGRPRWFGGSSQSNVVRIPGIRPAADDHPTKKPPALAAIFIRAHTEVGDVVLDPFMGEGTTLVAAKSLSRRVVGVELDERWCARAVESLSRPMLFSLPPVTAKRIEAVSLWGKGRIVRKGYGKNKKKKVPLT